MNVLILSCGTGGGHNAAGAAVQKQLQKQGHQVVMINPYQLKSNRLAGVIDKVYRSGTEKQHTFWIRIPAGRIIPPSAVSVTGLLY